MTRTHRSVCGLLATTLLLVLVACNNDDTAAPEKVLVSTADTDVNELNSMSQNADALTAVVGTSEIPYPVYPNGQKYRVGGENGLKIVVFQTEDSFQKVDQYYSSMSDNSGMPRLMAMNDYVRYSKTNEDLDPWATHLPGIVIHEFGDETERASVGASDQAITNIIMSF